MGLREERQLEEDDLVEQEYPENHITALDDEEETEYADDWQEA